MQNRFALPALATASVAVWVLGVVMSDALPSKLPSHASDQQILDWVNSNTNVITMGAWTFMCGCVLFVVFAIVLRSRLGEGPLTTAVFAGSVMAAVFGMLAHPDFVTAIDKGDVSPAAAAAYHSLGDLGFTGIELSIVLVMGGSGLLAYKSGVMPRWWGAISIFFAVVAVIGPIGWTMVMFGFPLWMLVTPWLVGRPARRTAAAPAAATA